MVDFLLYAASLDASVATRSKISKHQIRCVTPSVNLRLLTVDKGVEDRHGAVGNASVRVNLLQDCQKMCQQTSQLHLIFCYENRVEQMRRVRMLTRPMGPVDAVLTFVDV